MNAVPLIRMSGLSPPLQPALQLRRGAGSGGGVVNGRGVLALHPASIAIRLEKLHKGLHGDFNHVFTARTLEEEQRTGGL